MITVSLKLSALLGKRIVLTGELAGYPAGSIAVIEEFTTTVEGSYFRLQFETLPGSFEEVLPLELMTVAKVLRPGDTFGHSLRRYFKPGFPPHDRKFNLVVG
jgi:hypothetical protein